MKDLKNKNLGILWIGDIPDHWKIESLGNVVQIILSNADKKSSSNETKVSLCNYTDVYYNNHITSNINFLEATATELEIERFQLKIDDVLITKDSETPNDIAIPSLVVETKKNLLCGYHLSILRPIEKKLYGSYLLFLIMSECVKSQFSSCATGITRYGLGYKHIKNISICLPPLKTQKAIAHFLDRKTAAIDTLIANKQRLIQLLEEKRTALINQAVTKGLNAIAPMKDSGISCIGEIPEHWGIVLLKRVANVRYGLGQPPPEIENGLPLIRATNVKSGSIYEKNMIYVDINEVPKGRNAILVAGEIIVVRSGAYTGDSAIISPKYEGAIAGYDMVATIKKGFSPFIAWQLLSKQVRYFQFAINQLRAAQSHLNAEELNETILCFPPIEQQEQIDLYLRAKTGQIDTLISKNQSSIEKLQEYRRSLITAAVTGKLDITQEKTP